MILLTQRGVLLMNELIIKEYKIKTENISPKTIYHFSDCHLTLWDEFSDEAEIEKAKKQTEEWQNIRKYFADAHKEPYDKAQQNDAKTHFQNLLKASENGNALIIAGDTFNYLNKANIRAFENCISKFNTPYMILCGNHDTPKDMPDDGVLSTAKSPFQIIRFNDMTIIGFDNSERIITKEQIDGLESVLKEEKPIIISMHIPIKTKDNCEKLEKCGEYFYINYDGCPKENIEFVEIIKSNAKNIICVLAGHLHFSDNSEITDGLMQYVSSQGITGNLNKYIIE